MVVKIADKEELKRRGVWRDFCNRRDELRAEGMTPKLANDQAVMEFLGGDAPESVLSSSPDQGSDEKPKPSEIEVNFSELPRKSKPTEMIQWVAGNLRGEIDVEGCPGRDAYALLLDCQQFPSFRLEFWKTMYTKVIPSRAQLNDDGNDVELNGEMTLKVLDKIATIAANAKSEEGAECVES